MPTQAEIEAAWKIAGLDVSRETIREILEAAARVRWQPIATRTTQPEIEAAAEAIYRAEFQSALYEGFPFDGESDGVKDGYREKAKAALEAADRARLDRVPKFRTCSVCDQEAHNCKCPSRRAND